MFAFLRALLDYLYPPNRWRKPPGHLMSTYDITDSSEQHDLLMYLNRARSPKEAARLLKRYHVGTAAELLPLLPVKARIGVKARMLRLLRSILGHQEGDPYRVDYAERERRRL